MVKVNYHRIIIIITKIKLGPGTVAKKKKRPGHCDGHKGRWLGLKCESCPNDAICGHPWLHSKYIAPSRKRLNSEIVENVDQLFHQIIKIFWYFKKLITNDDWKFIEELSNRRV